MLIRLASAAPVLLGLAAAATWGAADFTGGISARRGPAGRVVFVAHGTSLALLSLLVLVTNPGSLTASRSAWALLSGVAGGVALMLFYEALAAGAMGLSAALAGVLTAALPVAVSLAREGRPATLQITGFAVAAIAIGLIAWSPEMLVDQAIRASATNWRSLALSTVAGLGFGVQLVVLHLASAQGSILRAITFSRAGGAAAGAAATLWAALRGRASQRGTTPQSLARQADGLTAAQPGGTRSRVGVFLAMAALAGLLDTAGNGLYMGAALAGRMDVAAVLSSLYPCSTILLAAWLLKERTTRLQAAGMALALVAVALISA